MKRIGRLSLGLLTRLGKSIAKQSEGRWIKKLQAAENSLALLRE